MARLPVPGSDHGNWGDILNDFLSQVHNPDGSLRSNIVHASQIADGSITDQLVANGTITESKLDATIQAKLNSSHSPHWSDIANKPTVIAEGANQAAARDSISAAPKQSFYIDNYPGSDPTGATSSDAAVAAAIADLGANPGVIEFGQGRYRLENTKELSKAAQYFKGQGIGLTTIDYRGSGPALKCWDSTVNPNGLEAPGYGGGVLGGLTIDGTNNPNNGAIGLLIGDLVKPTVEDMYIFGFTNAGCIGFLGQNRYSWTEYGYFRVKSSYNANCFVFEAHPNHPLPAAVTYKTSFSYNYFHFAFSAEANQNGLIVRHNSSIVGATWFMNYNCNPGATNSAAAITIGESDTDDCHVQGLLAWLGEATNPGDVAHYDMNVGAISSLRGYGSLVFQDYSNAPWRAGTAAPYRVVFYGRVNCPSLGHYSDSEIPFVTIGDPGRFGARGDDANYVDFIEGDNGSWPALNARGPSADIGIQVNTKGWGSFQYNGKPVAITADTVPTVWNSPGTRGQMVADGDNFYVCVSDNVWKKVPLQDL